MELLSTFVVVRTVRRTPPWCLSSVSCEQTLASRLDPREGAGVRVIFQAATEEPSVVLPTLFSSGILTCRLWFISRLRTYMYQAGVLYVQATLTRAFIWYRTSELSELPSASLPGSTCHSISTPWDSPTTRVHRSGCDDALMTRR